MKAFLIGLLFIIIASLVLGFWSFVVWAIYTVVMHITGG